MQLGRRIGDRIGRCKRRSCCPVTGHLRPLAPPVLAAPQQSRRNAVVAQAKRSSKRSKTQEPDAEDAAAGWDAALANIPTEDEAEPATAAPQASADAEDDIATAAAAERTANQGPDPSEAAASTSYAGDGTPQLPAKKPMSTLISLAEYTMLMDAKAAREREVAARKEREAREAAGLSALTVPEPAPLDLNRQGFQAFVLEGGEQELLVAETVDGRLVLAESYVATRAAGGEEGAPQQFSRPTLEGAVPDQPLLFQVIPWVERGASDVLKRKAPTNKVKKVYFLGMDAPDGGASGDPVFDLDRVYVFDGKSNAISRSEVRVVGNLPFLEPVLRIRPSGLTLEEAYLLPDPIEVSMATAVDLADMTEEELAERLEELERSAESLDEFDEMPDVPSVDMM